MSGGPLDRFLLPNKNTQKTAQNWDDSSLQKKRPTMSSDTSDSDAIKKKRREDDEASPPLYTKSQQSGGVIKKQIVKWSWLQEGQQWKEYSPEITKKLEEAASNNRRQCVVDDERFVDLIKMVQRRTSDPSKQRMVKREEIIVTTAAIDPEQQEDDEETLWQGKHSPVSKGSSNKRDLDSPSKMTSPIKTAPAVRRGTSKDDISPPPTSNQSSSKPQFQWFWQSDNGWVAYAHGVNQDIEGSFQAKKRTYKIDKERFIDFDTKRQCRSDNPSKFRPVRRDEIKRPPDSQKSQQQSQQQQHQQQKHTQSSSPADKVPQRGVWYWQADDGKWSPYENDISDKIEESYLAKKKQAPVDDERFIDLQNSIQKRYDNANRKRFVKRVEEHPHKQSLTPDQLRKIEQNRQECLRKKAEKEKQKQKHDEDDDLLGSPAPPKIEDDVDEPYNYLEDDDYYPKREDRRKAYRCGNKYLTLADIPSWHETAREVIAVRPLVVTKSSNYVINEAINKKIAILRGDITTLEVDAIVNAARPSLMGGGGVDGAIHLAAGDGLDRECAYLNGCNVGEAKLSQGYRLPAHYVIHTVGPIGEDKNALTGCYLSTMELVEKYNIKSVAFCCISTGVYGYPATKAANIALSTIREWMQKNANYKKIDKIIFCLYLEEDEALYQKLIQFYFPVDPATLPNTSSKSSADRSSESSRKDKQTKHKFVADDEDTHVSYDNFDEDDVL